MRNLVPHFILEQYARGESAGHKAAGGRFAAVSLFADITVHEGFETARFATKSRRRDTTE